MRKIQSLLFLLSIVFASLSHAKKSKTKKQSITVVDPKARSSKPSTVVDKGAEKSPEDLATTLPAALTATSADFKKKAPVAKPKDQSDEPPVLPQQEMGVFNIESIKTLVEQKNYDDAISTLDVWLTLRNDIHTGERLRLNLLKALLLARQGKYVRAQQTMASMRRYLDLATEDLSATLDKKRAQDLRAHLDLTEYDIRLMQGAEE